MPEGPEVRVYADFLMKNMVGKRLTGLEYDEKSRYQKNGLKNHQQLLDALPTKIIHVYAVGKKIVINLESGQSLMSSLEMEGRWNINRATKHTNIWMDVGDDRFLFEDCRHHGHLDIYLSDADLNEKLDTIGPDLLSETVTRDMWLRVVRNARIAHLEICDFLLEQKYFSGVGNYCRAEALYRAKIRPNAKLKEISDEDHDQIRIACIDVLNKSYDAQGATLKTFLTPDGNKGLFEVVVYGKDYDPLGNPVK